jgi:hypothetical protein
MEDTALYGNCTECNIYHALDNDNLCSICGTKED